MNQHLVLLDDRILSSPVVGGVNSLVIGLFLKLIRDDGPLSGFFLNLGIQHPASELVYQCSLLVLQKSYRGAILYLSSCCKLFMLLLSRSVC